MKPITGKQFIASEIFFALGVGLIVCPGDLPFSLAAPLFVVSGIIRMSPGERSRPLRRKDVALIVAVLLASVLYAIASKHFLSDEADAQISRVLRHPAFILPLWLLITWRTYRQWIQASHTTTVA